ncbi:cutinase [Nocardia mexicana]|uniref:Cutinase n=2 Tax=Nocardia mexicana TaxID=279262 RepID=A0A370HAG9_9NOCA|nr:cutinase [Nocardia mexicana]
MIGVATAALGTAMALGWQSAVSSAAPATADSDCPALYALGVQGTGQSSPDAAPTDDTGMLSNIFAPMLAAEPYRTERAYVPYDAGFGGAVPGGNVSYMESVLGGLERLRSMAESVADRCPRTRLALAGYSQGAHIVSIFAQEIGAGRSPIPADRVAAVALMGDPTRLPDAPLFPGVPDQISPEPPPGTIADGLAHLIGEQPQTTGGGIGPVRDLASDFGALTGRVASFCIPGDLTCDAPTASPVLHMLVNIAGQALLPPDDPMAALSSIADALGRTVREAATDVVQHDIQGLSPGTLAWNQGKTLSERLAEASDPRALLDPYTGQPSLIIVATIAVNALTSILGTVLGYRDVGDIMAMADRDPLGALALLARKVFTTVPTRTPAPKVRQLVGQAFDALSRLITDNTELASPETWVKYRDTVVQHGAYAAAAITAGRTPTGFIADWFIALARIRQAPVAKLPVPPDLRVVAPAPPQAPPPPVSRPPQEPAAPRPLADPPPTTGAPARTEAPAVPPEPVAALEERTRVSRNLTWMLLLSEGACLLYGGRRTLLLDIPTTEYLRAAIHYTARGTAPNSAGMRVFDSTTSG